MIYQEIFSDVDTKMENPNSDTEVNDPFIGNSFNATRRKIMEYLKFKTLTQIRNQELKIFSLT